MNCDTAEEQLLDYLEGQLDPDQSAQMRAHVDDCPSCRRAVRDTRELLDAMDLARRRQEQAWRNESRRSVSAGAEERARGFTFDAGHRLGDFEIIGEIGRGGMGVVYRARQITLNRVVALKVLPATVCQTEDAIKRFVREAQAAAKLHHTNIVPVYAQGECDGHFFYAMELIDGPNLGHLMKDDRTAILSGLDALAASGISMSTDTSGISRMDATSTRRRADYRRIAELMAAVADGLEHAHRQNVIHRDIKPQNLLLGHDGQFHITDFGLARLLDEPNMTVTGEMLGTPAYMSPEQIDADRSAIDHRTDVYSLGVTLYELLTGRRPFDGMSREQVIARIRDREPTPPRKIDAHIPIDLDTICLRAMEKSPNRRYPSAEAMSQDLRRFAQDKPIHARRVSPVEKALKWIRRHPAKFTIAMLVVVMIAGGIVWEAQARANRHRRADELVLQAKDVLAVQDYREWDKAREKLLEAAPLGPDVAEARKVLGLSYVMDDAKEALRILEEAHALDPDDTETIYIIAWTMRRLDRDQERDEWLERAEHLGGPKTEYDYFFRATARVWSEPDAAADDYEEANRLRQSKKQEVYLQAIIHNGRARNQRMYHTRSADDFSTIESLFVNACFQSKDNAYARYLLSLAYKIRAEIHYDAGQMENARERFELSRRKALESITVPAQSPRGYAALADFWESVGDRNSLAEFDPPETLANYIKKHQGSGNGVVDAFDWLRELDRALENAVRARIDGLNVCDNKEDRIEFLEYRWLDYFWMERLDEAQADIDQLGKLYSNTTDMRALWFRRLIPALLAAEREGPDVARKMIESDQDENRFSDVTSRASMLHILGDADAARDLVADCEAIAQGDNGLDNDAPENWWANACRLLSDPDFDLENDWPDFNEPDSVFRAPPLFFCGAVALGRGDRDLARSYFQRCEACYDYENYNYLARAIRRRMDAAPEWPPWLSAADAPETAATASEP